MIRSKEDHISFLRYEILANLRKTIDAGMCNFSFVLMAQSIEIMGAYLDNKPMRASNQSLKRFCLAIEKLFPNEYYKANYKAFLYKQLRSCMVHMFLPTDKLDLRLSDDRNKHLKTLSGRLIINSENLYIDCEAAINKIIYNIENNKIKLKFISG